VAYLVNEAGDYLIHPDRSREFGFEFARRYQLSDDFPMLATVLDATLDATLGGAPDEARMVHDRARDAFGVAPLSLPLAQGPRAPLILASPYDAVLGPALAMRNSILLATGIAVLLALALAILLARSLTRPLEKMTLAVEAFGRGDAMAVPTTAQGEIGVL